MQRVQVWSMLDLPDYGDSKPDYLVVEVRPAAVFACAQTFKLLKALPSSVRHARGVQPPFHR
jgi:hypothetical protein